jgi:hypothetical protein
MRAMKNKLIIILAFLLLLGTIRSQQELSINDALPPYKLSATLLNNGHFFITTKYIQDSTKLLIYRELQSDTRPINYTSHIHVMIDSIVFQFPYENNSATGFPPPANVLKIEQLFRDTINNVPGINAKISAIMPGNSDVIHLNFRMEPVKRPSGGFIRFTTRVDSAKSSHRIACFYLFDTKIADNDRAPIVTSVGFYDKEKQFLKTGPGGIPEFWLALEGSPVKPGLTARGNLKEKDLLEPDLFMFGNWADNTTQGIIKGLGSFLWKDRQAQDNLTYTDSAVLLIWDEKNIPAKTKVVIASTEIGIVDSLEVVDAGSTAPGGGGDGIFYARGGGSGGTNCAAFDTLHQVNCADKKYHPYVPDSLQLIFIITNTSNKTINNVRLRIDQLPPDLGSSTITSSIIPSTLDVETSAVGTLSFFAFPRLYTKSFDIPITMLGNTNDTLALDKICITVPGILAKDSIVDLDFGFVCPSKPEIQTTELFLKGIRCRKIQSLVIENEPSSPNAFRLATPQPSELPANGSVDVPIEFTPPGLGDFQAKIIATITDTDDFPGGTSVTVSDTAIIKGTGKYEEFSFADTKDTLNFGKVCIGDTSIQEWPIINTGGCNVTISSFNINSTFPADYSLVNANKFPLIVPKNDVGSIGKAVVRFAPKNQGWNTGMLIIHSPSAPKDDTLFIKGYGDKPDYITDKNRIELDTICPAINNTFYLNLNNLSVCVIDIDTCHIIGSNGFFDADPPKFTIPSDGSATVNISANIPSNGEYYDTLLIRTGYGEVRKFIIHATVASRKLIAQEDLQYGDVRVGKSLTMPVTIKSGGIAGVLITNILIAGLNPDEFMFSGITLPLYIKPNDSATFNVTFSPKDIETRTARLEFIADPAQSCEMPEPILLEGRGIRPIISLPWNLIKAPDVCISQSVDTTFKIQNLGNGPLFVSSIDPVGTNHFTINETFPLKIDTGETKNIKYKFEPKQIGTFETKYIIQSDGDWIYKVDTLAISGRGIICAELSLDTIYAEVGKQFSIDVYIRPDTSVKMSATEFAGLMNSSGFNDISFSISYSKLLMRPIAGNLPVLGMMGGAKDVVVYADSSVVTYTKSDPLKSDTILASIVSDALLGNNHETAMKLKVHEFAGGYARIRAYNGALRLQYCALDKRLINPAITLNFVVITDNPADGDSRAIVNMIESGYARLSVFSSTGELISDLYEGKLDKGVLELNLPSGLVSGCYYLKLTTERNTDAILFLIAK